MALARRGSARADAAPTRVPPVNKFASEFEAMSYVVSKIETHTTE